jgi:hypothetical protein
MLLLLNADVRSEDREGSLKFREQIVTAVVGLLILVVLVQPAAAGHRPSSYCSPTGDLCQDVTRVNGALTLRITLAAEYFSRYRLCVIGPGTSTTCRIFRIRNQSGVFGSSVRWRRNFPDEGRGAYDVVWRSLPGGSRIGRILGFHVSA